jgi:hypothetical protein
LRQNFSDAYLKKTQKMAKNEKEYNDFLVSEFVLQKMEEENLKK